MESEMITKYINDLYSKKLFLKEEDYTSHMQLKQYVPTVDNEAACFLRLLIRIAKPKNILEIGTSVGFSTASMALAVKEYGGHITTIEFDKKAADQAEINFAKANVSEIITLKRGNARYILKDLKCQYDMIFQDVDKRLYPVLLSDCIRLLNHNGILLSDDALFSLMDLDEKWSSQIEPIRQYNELIMANPSLESILLPVGDGIMMSVKK